MDQQLFKPANVFGTSSLTVTNDLNYFSDAFEPSPTAQVSVLPCTEDGTFCIVDWNHRYVTLQSGATLIAFPFTKCRIRSAWSERSLIRNDVWIRKAVISLSGFSEWRYTLAPSCPAHGESALTRLAAELNYNLGEAARSIFKNETSTQSEAINPAETTPTSQPVQMSPSARQCLLDKYSSTAVLQRANLGPFTSEFLASRLSTHPSDSQSLSVQSARQLRQQWEAVPVSILCHNADGGSGGLSQWAAVTHPSKLGKSRAGPLCGGGGFQSSNKRKPSMKGDVDFESRLNDADAIGRLQREGALQTEQSLVQPLVNITEKIYSFGKRLWDACVDEDGMDESSPDFFSESVLWTEEPVLPSVMLLIRHGQQLAGDGGCGVDAGVPLSKLGQIQSQRTAEFLWMLTGHFNQSRTLAVISSRLERAVQTADIIFKGVECLGAKPASQNSGRCSAAQLGESLPSFPYEVTAPEVKEELEHDASSMNDAVFLLSAALRTMSGPLLPDMASKQWKPTDLCGGDIDLFGYASTIVQRYRFPPLFLRGPAKFAGCFIGGAPSMKSQLELGRSGNVIVSGHGNVIREFFLREVNFPRQLWCHVQLPHCAVVLVGMHSSGVRGFFLGDAGYVLAPLQGDPLALTFTPAIDGEVGKNILNRNQLMTDQLVTISLPESLVPMTGIAGHAGVRYPSVRDITTADKVVLLLRAGHNSLLNSLDMGLTDLGRRQMIAAAEWLAEFFLSECVGSCPKRWATAGLTSDCISIDSSLKQSLLILKETLKARLGPEGHDASLIPNQEALYPENLFSSSVNERGTLIALVTDDYHLLKYFGACYSIEPSLLRRAYWPHAGHLIVTVTPTGVAQLRTFGMISHLHPKQISILPAVPESEQCPNEGGDSPQPVSMQAFAEEPLSLPKSQMGLQFPDTSPSMDQSRLSGTADPSSRSVPFDLSDNSRPAPASSDRLSLKDGSLADAASPQNSVPEGTDEPSKELLKDVPEDLQVTFGTVPTNQSPIEADNKPVRSNFLDYAEAYSASDDEGSPPSRASSTSSDVPHRQTRWSEASSDDQEIPPPQQGTASNARLPFSPISIPADRQLEQAQNEQSDTRTSGTVGTAIIDQGIPTTSFDQTEFMSATDETRGFDTGRTDWKTPQERFDRQGLWDSNEFSEEPSPDSQTSMKGGQLQSSQEKNLSSALSRDSLDRRFAMEFAKQDIDEDPGPADSEPQFKLSSP